MMHRFACIMIIFSLLLALPGALRAEEKELVLRLAQEDSKATVAVEAYLAGDMLDTKVSVAMKGQRPSILNVVFIGSNTGRIVAKTVKQVYAAAEDEEPYITVKRGGFIRFGKKEKKKHLEGDTSRKQFVFELPLDKITADGKYELRIKVGTVKQRGGTGSRKTTFNFNLDELPKLVNN
jgi:hypothetical protein